MKLADAHLHLFRHGYAERYGRGWAGRSEVALYEALRRAHEIECGLVIGYEGQPKFHGNNRDLARWAKAYSWITPLSFVASTQSLTPRTFESRRRQGFAGIALYLETPQDVEALNRTSAAVRDWLNERRQIVSLNARPEALAALRPFLAELPGCSVLVSHLGLPGRYATPPSRSVARRILQPIRALAKLPNVGVKLSGLYAISDPSHAYPHRSARPLLRQLYDDFSAARLYWGSDFSPALEHVSFPQTIDALLELGWPANDLRRVLHDNLMRVIRQVGL
jgi:L-fuconolactonase